VPFASRKTPSPRRASERQSQAGDQSLRLGRDRGIRAFAGPLVPARSVAAASSPDTPRGLSHLPDGCFPLPRVHDREQDPDLRVQARQLQELARTRQGAGPQCEPGLLRGRPAVIHGQRHLSTVVPTSQRRRRPMTRDIEAIGLAPCFRSHSSYARRRSMWETFGFLSYSRRRIWG
jgi:hypothetical protein